MTDRELFLCKVKLWDSIRARIIHDPEEAEQFVR
jgi:hypothetical protein